MAFRTQKLTNKFPKWTKIRRDPSSFGSRMFSVFADYFDFRTTELVKLRDELDLLKLHMGRPHAWKIALTADDQLPVVVTVGGTTTWTAPTTVTGTDSAGTHTLSSVDNLADLHYHHYTRFGAAYLTPYTNNDVYDSSSPTVYNDIDTPDRLQVIVENSLDFFRRTQFTNRAASGFHMLLLTGRDENGLEVTEYLPVPDDGVYWTKNIFSELTEVIQEGFNGSVLVTLNRPVTATRMLHDPYHLAMSDSEEGPLKLALSNDVLQSYVQRIKLGENYRTGNPDVVDNDELIWEQALADTAGTALTGIVDLALNWDTARLYALTGNGNVYVYDHGLTPFTPFVDDSDLTTDVFVEVQPVKHWATLNETVTLYTWFLKPRFPVAGVTIKRRDPNGVVEYLQANLTWAAGVYEHIGKDPARKFPEETWDEITFTSLCDVYGEWEFYCTTRATNGESTVAATKIMVDKLTALSEVATSVASPIGLYFDKANRLCVMDATTIHRFSELADVYLLDGPNQQIYFREDYTSVEVTI